MTNLSKLQEAYSLLGIIEDDKSVAPMVKEIKRHIHEFMVDNEPSPKKGELNLWDFTANDALRPVLCGIFHDKENGMAVATNAHILVADKALYDESKADTEETRRPIDKYGKFIDGRYPNWQNVIPTRERAKELGYERYYVDVKDLDDYIKRCNAYMKINGYTGKCAKRIVYNVPNSNLWFYAPLFRTFLLASGGEVYLRNDKPDGAAVYWSDERIVLIMPMIVDAPEKIKYDDELYMLD